MGIDGAIGWLEAAVVKVVGSSKFSKVSGISICIGSGEVGCEGMMVSCGGGGAFSEMRVEYVLKSDSGSSVILIIVWEA
jgi:hypothetical protein